MTKITERNLTVDYPPRKSLYRLACQLIGKDGYDGVERFFYWLLVVVGGGSICVIGVVIIALTVLAITGYSLPAWVLLGCFFPVFPGMRAVRWYNHNVNRLDKYQRKAILKYLELKDKSVFPGLWDKILKANSSEAQAIYTELNHLVYEQSTLYKAAEGPEVRPFDLQEVFEQIRNERSVTIEAREELRETLPR